MTEEGAGRRIRRCAFALALLVGLGASSAPAQEAERWTFTGSARISHTTNLLFVPDGPDDTIGGGVLTLAYTRLRRSYSFAGTAWVLGSAYREFDIFNGVRGGLALSGTVSLSPVARLRYSEALASGFNPQRLYGTGDLLPQIRVTNNVASAGLSYDFTRSTRGDLSFDSTFIRYRSDVRVLTPQITAETFPEQAAGPVPDPTRPPIFGLPLDAALTTAGLASLEGIDTRTLDLFTYRVGAGVTHEFSPKTQAGVTVGYRSSRYSNSDVPTTDAGIFEAGASVKRTLDSTASLSFVYGFQLSLYDPTTTTQNVGGQFAKELTSKWNLDASLGASWYTSDLTPDTGWSVVGGVGASKRGRRGSFLLRYDHTLYQALGFGRVITTDLLYSAGNWLPWKRVIVGAYAGLSASRDELDSGFTFSDGFAGVYGSLQVHKRMRVGVDYSYRRYSFRALPDAAASVFGVSISYGRTWK
jgi:hypothetical protein